MKDPCDDVNCTNGTCDNGKCVCKGGYYLKDGICTTCSITCPSGEYKSASCTADSDIKCQEKKCTCEHGVATTGEYCPKNGDEQCKTCKDGWSGDLCEIAPLPTCKNPTDFRTSPRLSGNMQPQKIYPYLIKECKRNNTIPCAGPGENCNFSITDTSKVQLITCCTAGKENLTCPKTGECPYQIGTGPSANEDESAVPVSLSESIEADLGCCV